MTDIVAPEGGDAPPGPIPSPLLDIARSPVAATAGMRSPRWLQARVVATPATEPSLLERGESWIRVGLPYDEPTTTACGPTPGIMTWVGAPVTVLMDDDGRIVQITDALTAPSDDSIPVNRLGPIGRDLARAQEEAREAFRRYEELKSNSDAARNKADQALADARAAEASARQALADAGTARGIADGLAARVDAADGAAAAAQAAADEAKRLARAGGGEAAEAAKRLAEKAQAAADESKRLAEEARTASKSATTTAQQAQAAALAAQSTATAVDAKAAEAAAKAVAAQAAAEEAKQLGPERAEEAARTARDAAQAAAEAKALADRAEASALGVRATADRAAEVAGQAGLKLTVSDARPRPEDAVGKPEGAIWEYRSGDSYKTLARWILVKGEWRQSRVGTDYLAPDSVSREQLLDGAVSTAKIGDLAVTNAKVGDLSVSKLTATGGAEFNNAVVRTLLADRIFVEGISANSLIVGGANLVTDPRFETVGTATDLWSGGIRSLRATPAESASNPAGSARVLRIVGPTTGIGTVHVPGRGGTPVDPRMPAAVGTPHEMSVWMRIVARPATGIGVRISLDVRGENGSYGRGTSGTLSRTAEGWTHQTLSVTPSEEYPALSASLGVPAGYTVELAEVSVRRVDPVTIEDGTITASKLTGLKEIWGKLAAFASVTTEMLTAGNANIQGKAVVGDLVGNTLRGVVVEGGEVRVYGDGVGDPEQSLALTGVWARSSAKGGRSIGLSSRTIDGYDTLVVKCTGTETPDPSSFAIGLPVTSVPTSARDTVDRGTPRAYLVGELKADIGLRVSAGPDIAQADSVEGAASYRPFAIPVAIPSVRGLTGMAAAFYPEGTGEVRIRNSRIIWSSEKGIRRLSLAKRSRTWEQGGIPQMELSSQGRRLLISSESVATLSPEGGYESVPFHTLTGMPGGTYFCKYVGWTGSKPGAPSHILQTEDWVPLATNYTVSDRSGKGIDWHDNGFSVTGFGGFYRISYDVDFQQVGGWGGAAWMCAAPRSGRGSGAGMGQAVHASASLSPDCPTHLSATAVVWIDLGQQYTFYVSKSGSRDPRLGAVSIAVDYVRGGAADLGRLQV